MQKIKIRCSVKESDLFSSVFPVCIVADVFHFTAVFLFCLCTWYCYAFLYFRIRLVPLELQPLLLLHFITNHESRILMSNFRKSTATSLPIVSSSWRLLNSRPYLSFLPVMYLLLLPIVQYDMLLNYASFYSIPTQTSMCCSRFTTSLP